MWDSTHSNVRFDAFKCQAHWTPRWIHEGCAHTTHSYVRFDAFICAIWRIHMWDLMYSHVRPIEHRIASMRAEHTPRIHMCNLTHLFVRFDAFTFEFDAFICAIWRIYMWDLMHSHLSLTHAHVKHRGHRIESIRAATSLMSRCTRVDSESTTNGVAHIHTHSLSLPLSLSLTHTHTCRFRVKYQWRVTHTHSHLNTHTHTHIHTRRFRVNH